MAHTIHRLRALLDWIDAVPRNAVLPAMPGFDRDEVDALIERNDPCEVTAVAEAIEMAYDWIACVPDNVKAALPALAI